MDRYNPHTHTHTQKVFGCPLTLRELRVPITKEIEDHSLMKFWGRAQKSMCILKSSRPLSEVFPTVLRYFSAPIASESSTNVVTS